MATLQSNELAWITCRANHARAGASRSGCAPILAEMKAGTAGDIIWNRDPATDGDPADTSLTWSNVRN